MKTIIRKRICACVCMASFMWMLSLGSAIDLGTLSILEIVAQGIIASALLLTSTIIGGLIS